MVDLKGKSTATPVKVEKEKEGKTFLHWFFYHVRESEGGLWCKKC